MQKRRVLYVVHEFPQISQAYILSEIEALETEYDIHIVTLRKPNIAAEIERQAETTDDLDRISEIIKEFKPDVLHSHYVWHGPTMLNLAERSGVPFTIRAHSFDMLSNPSRKSFMKRLKRRLRGWPEVWVPYPEHASRSFNSDYCLGVLVFPFEREMLEETGVRPEKIRDCFPVIDFDRFHDRGPNGDAIMNVGVCTPKKKMTDFIDLAASMPDRRFNLYAMGYYVDDIRKYNEAAGNLVHVIPPLQPRDMPAEYKKHQWMVYTANHQMNSVGWPMAVAEAQASGVGVCIANIRPDLRDYLGDAGYLFDSIDEVRKIVSQPVPDGIRERGFEQARKSDIRVHKKLLTDLWENAFRKAAAA